jgi:hypothetical protein
MAPSQASFAIGLNAVILTVTEESPRVLTVPGPGGEAALPFGSLDPGSERTLELALRVRVREQTGLELGYVEQLYTFGDRDRDPRVRHEGVRPISIGYLALVRETAASGAAAWRDAYRFFPWEDWRRGRPRLLDEAVVPALDAWLEEAERPALRRHRRERADITFGLGGAAWDGERVLERYELLYEGGLAAESSRDHRARRRALAVRGEAEEPGPAGAAAAPAVCDAGARARPPGSPAGEPMALDHRRILATALGRTRAKVKYRPVVFELMPPTFTLYQLQRVVEALAGVHLHKGNFRRLVEKGGLVEGTGEQAQTGGRPAELFRFRREVLRERPAPGVGLPGARR